MNPMFRFLIGRLALLVPTFLGVTIVAFGFIRLLPGDPVLLLAGERGITEERYNQLMEQFGFSRPIWEQYFDYLVGLLQGDLGILHRHQEAGGDRVLHAVSRDRGTVALRHHSRGRDRDPGGDLRRGQARLLLRPDDHGHRAGRLLDADLLVGAAADHPVFRHAAMDAGLGPHLLDVLLSRSRPASC
jgi:hypothetical protein